MNRSARAFLEGFEAAIAAVDDGNLHRVIVDALQSIIAEIPAADVVEVVRCKDCKHCDMVDDNERWCLGWGSPARLVAPDSYCSHGIRKEGQRCSGLIY